MSAPIRKTRISWNEPGHIHFLTCSCYRRLPLLTRERTRRWVIEAMQRLRSRLDVALWAYVIMPEHVHLLVHPRRPRYEMKSILGALKQPVSLAARRYLEATGQTRWLERLTVRYPGRTVFRFWQPGGGFDHNVVLERSVPAIVEYIQTNPVRRELVATPTEWEWSSARFWDGWEDVPIGMDDPSAVVDGRAFTRRTAEAGEKPEVAAAR